MYDIPIMQAGGTETPSGIVNKRPLSALRRPSITSKDLGAIPENREIGRAGSPPKLPKSALFPVASSSTPLRPESVHATGFDPRTDAAQIIDGHRFWITTGLFPHRLTLRFASAVVVSRVSVSSAGVRAMTLEWWLASERLDTSREPAVPRRSEQTPKVLQTFQVGSQLDKLVLTLESSWEDDFAVIWGIWGS